MIAYYDTGDSFFTDTDIFINKCAVDESNLHSHSFIEIAFITKGSGIHRVGDMEFPCGQGEIYIINTDVPHQFMAHATCELEIYNCIFKPMFFNYALIDSKKFYDITHHFLIKLLDGDAHFESPRITLDPSTFKSIYSIYENMLQEYTSKEEGYTEILKAELIKLIILILRTIKKELAPPNSSSIKNELLEKAITYIHSNYYDQISIEELSMMAFLSKSHFCRLFKDYSGMTVKEYTQKIRIQEACRLLLNSEQKISDISTEVGYSDLKHFISLFKKLMGQTPSEYRKNIYKKRE